MSYIVVENLASGVDRRRPIHSSEQGGLWEGINGHLSRGGDFEKRKAFVETYDLDGLDTFGLQTIGTDVYVFGSVATPGGLPGGVNYQRLQHPDGSAMSEMLWSTLFDGKIYAIAKYANDDVLHFYDGELVNDWIAGKVRSGMTDNDGIAEHLRALIAEDTNYVATRTTDTITIEAATAGDPFTIEASAENGGATDDQSITLTETQANISGGSETLATGSFKITGGTNNAGTNQITSVKVDGVEIMNVAQDWATSNSSTADDVASQINTFSSSPEYTAAADGSTVVITAAAGTGSDPNGFVVDVTTAGDVTIGNVENMSGGEDGTSNQAQKYTAEIGGTFEAGDLFTITIDDKVFGHAGNPDFIGDFALTYGNKMYVGAESLLLFSQVNNATQWNADTDVGAGAINMANQDEGSAELTGLAPYQGNLAVFSRSVIQIWFVEADDANNQQLQVLRRTGTTSPGSIQAFGDIDVFYLHSSGVRSLRARDSSNNASVNDVGTLVDPIVQDWLDDLTTTEITKLRSIIEPTDNRYWLAIGSRILIFSYFPGSKISGWTWYEPGFNAEWFADAGDGTGPWVRASDKIYKYGGSDNATYGSDYTVTCWIPFLDGGKPGHSKGWHGFDLKAEGAWDVLLITDPNNLNRHIDIGSLNNYTPNDMHSPAGASSYCASPKLTHKDAGEASISGLMLYYQLEASESE